MTAPVRFPRFFVTSPSPCPYLPGKTERKVFTELSGAHAAELNEALGRIGFRRSQNVAYRPSCADCKEFTNAMDCKKFNNFMAKLFGFVFKSDRNACLNMIRNNGYENFASYMAGNKLVTIKKK